MLEGIERVYDVAFAPGEDPIGQVVPNGKTDRQIVREMLAPRGVAGGDVDAGFPSSSGSRASCTPPRATSVLDGDAREQTVAALRALRADGHVLALLTGNLEPIAPAQDGPGRAGRVLRRRPGRRSGRTPRRGRSSCRSRAARAAANGRPHPAEDTVVIGDTPLDVAAAHADGVRAIGVARLALHARRPARRRRRRRRRRARRGRAPRSPRLASQVIALFSATLVRERGAAVLAAADVRQVPAADARVDAAGVDRLDAVLPGGAAGGLRVRPRPERAARAAPRRRSLHVAVVAVALVVLPVAVPDDARPPETGNPVWWQLGLMAVAIGLPFFALASTRAARAALAGAVGPPPRRRPLLPLPRVERRVDRRADRLPAADRAAARPGRAGPLVDGGLRAAGRADGGLRDRPCCARARAPVDAEAIVEPPPAGGATPIDWRRRARWVALAFVPVVADARRDDLHHARHRAGAAAVGAAAGRLPAVVRRRVRAAARPERR